MFNNLVLKKNQQNLEFNHAGLCDFQDYKNTFFP